MRLRSAYKSRDTPKSNKKVNISGSHQKSSMRRLRESTQLSRGASPASTSMAYDSQDPNTPKPLDNLIDSVLNHL